MHARDIAWLKLADIDMMMITVVNLFFYRKLQRTEEKVNKVWMAKYPKASSIGTELKHWDGDGQSLQQEGSVIGYIDRAFNHIANEATCNWQMNPESEALLAGKHCCDRDHCSEPLTIQANILEDK